MPNIGGSLVDVDPSTSPGLKGKIGDVATLDTNAYAGMWLKTGDGLTDWSRVLAGISNASADNGFLQVQLSYLNAPNAGLKAQLQSSSITSLFSHTDTNSIDMSYSSGVYSANLRLSSTSASSNNQLVSLTIQTDGLKAEIPNASIRGLVSASLPIAYDASTGVISIPNQNANLFLAGPTTGSGVPSFRKILGIDLITPVNPSSYPHSASEGELVLVDTSGSRTIVLPTHSSGRYVIVKDKTGQALANNITIQRNGNAGTIDNVAGSKVINVNYDSLILVSDGVSGWWSI